LIAGCERKDLTWEGGADQVTPAAFGQRGEHGLECLAEAQIEHLVGFVEDDCLGIAQVERATSEMVAQATGGADDHDRAAGELSALAGHAGAACNDTHTDLELSVEPLEFAPNLGGELAGRGNQQDTGTCAERRRCVGLGSAVDQERADHEAQGYGLTGTGARGNAEILAHEIGGKHSLLNGGEFAEAMLAEGVGERSGKRRKRV
jgi:hypothetical protein